jgi:hypothetical protein
MAAPYPERIVPYPPLADIISETGKPLTKEDSEMLLWLAEIKSQMTREMPPDELEFLKMEERRVERYFNNKSFSFHPSLSILDCRSFEAGLKGVFIGENTQMAPFVDDHKQLTVGSNFLSIVDGLLGGKDMHSWMAGLDYLIRFLKLGAEIRGEAPAGEENNALCHLRAWEEGSNAESLIDESARAAAIYWNAQAGSHSLSRVDVSRENVCADFSLVRFERAGQKVFDRISELTHRFHEIESIP